MEVVKIGKFHNSCRVVFHAAIRIIYNIICSFFPNKVLKGCSSVHLSIAGCGDMCSIQDTLLLKQGHEASAEVKADGVYFFSTRMLNGIAGYFLFRFMYHDINALCIYVVERWRKFVFCQIKTIATAS